MAPSPPIRIGVMGCARIAKRSVIPAIQSLPEFTLVGVASRTPEKGTEFSLQFECEYIGGYQDLIERPDIRAIYMPLPTGLHAEWAAKALMAGKHLLIEKSLALSLAEAESLVQLAQRQQLVMMENYMFEHHAQQPAVKTLMEESLGEIRLFRATFCFPPLSADDFRYNKTLGGGALLDAGGYPLKACQVFMGPELRVLSACLNIDHAGVDIWGGAMLETTTGDNHIPLQIAFGFDHYYQCGIEVLGQRGRLTTNRTFTAGMDFVPTAQLETPEGQQDIKLPSDNHFIRILQHFHHHVCSGESKSVLDEILCQARLQDQVRQLADYPKESAPCPPT